MRNGTEPTGESQGFNLILEILLIDSRPKSRDTFQISCFNLILEILLIDRALAFTSTPLPALRFNLILEILLIDRAE